MSNELQACPHCGVALPAVQDAFCSECRNPLDVAPVKAGEIHLAVREMSVAQPDSEWLMNLLSPCNAAGFVIVAASFIPASVICFVSGDDRDGMKLVLGGPLALLIDLVYRLRSSSGHLLPDGGGKLLYIPVWLLAIFWCLYGLWQLVS